MIADTKDLRQRPSPAECKQTLDDLRKDMGDHQYLKLLPRRIASPSTHCSHALYRLCLLSCGISQQRRPEYIGAVCAGETARMAIKYNLPAWYVGEDLMEALRRTQPPNDLKPEDIHWPLPSLTFFLPETKGMKLAFGGRQPLWITGCLIRKADYPASLKPVEKDGTPAHDRIFLHIVADLPSEGMTEYHSIIRVDQPLSEWAKYPFQVDLVLREAEEDFTEKDEQLFAQQMTYLFISMVMLLGQERPAPDFIAPGEPCPSKGKGLPKDPNVPEDFDRLWTPSWLGRYYRIKKPPILSGPHGTHASPIMHWRRGVLRPQAYGPKWSLRKTVWIEPVLVNAPKEDQA